MAQEEVVTRELSALAGTIDPAEATNSRQLALPSLILLRWIAVTGQAAMILLSYYWLKFDLPYNELILIVSITAVSNLALAFSERGRSLHSTKLLIPIVLTVDTMLLSGLLYLSGGTENPFFLLYIIHVAMAAVALNRAWTIWMIGLSLVCLIILCNWHVELHLEDLSHRLMEVSHAFAVMLVACVTAYCVDRVTSALRKRESQITHARALATRNERLASLTTLAAGAAHELGTPLGTIAVIARELEVAAQNDPQGPLENILEDASLVRSQVRRCRAIIDRMSAHALMERDPTIQKIRCEDLVADIREEIGKRSELVKLEPSSCEEVIGCQQDLVQVLAPLLKNAIDAGQREATLKIQRRHGTLIFEVCDQGSGMDASTLARVGEPFFTTKGPGKGTGLGIYLVRLFAEKLAGRLEIRSELGVGTTALFTISEATLTEQADESLE